MRYCRHFDVSMDSNSPGMLSPRGQCGLEAKFFGLGLGLGLVVSGIGLVLGLTGFGLGLTEVGLVAS